MPGTALLGSVPAAMSSGSVGSNSSNMSAAWERHAVPPEVAALAAPVPYVPEPAPLFTGDGSTNATGGSSQPPLVPQGSGSDPVALLQAIADSMRSGAPMGELPSGSRPAGQDGRHGPRNLASATDSSETLVADLIPSSMLPPNGQGADRQSSQQSQPASQPRPSQQQQQQQAGKPGAAPALKRKRKQSATRAGGVDDAAASSSAEQLVAEGEDDDPNEPVWEQKLRYPHDLYVRFPAFE